MEFGDESMKRFFTVFAMSVLAALVIGCGGAKDNKKEAAKEPMAKPVRQDILIQCAEEPKSLDSHNSTAIITAMATRNLHGNLLRRNGKGDIVCELAEGYTVNKNFTVYTFKLRDNLKFSDGSPLTSADVKYTYERALKGKGVLFKVMQSIEAPDAKTVVITLKNPGSNFPSSLALEYFGIYSKKAMEEGMDIAKLPKITSGAYYVESWEQGKLQLKANPHYYAGKAKISNATIKYLDLDDPNYYKEFLESKVDYLAVMRSNRAAELDARKEIEIIPFDTINWQFMSLNNTVPTLADRNVRLALHYGLDREAMTKAALGDYALPANFPVTPGMSGYIGGYEPEYNLVKAKEYMAKSRYPQGFTLKIQWNSQDRKKLVEVMTKQLKQLNIAVEPVRVNTAEARSNIRSGKYEALLWSYTVASQDIGYMLPIYKKGNEQYFSKNPDDSASMLLEQAMRLDGNDRKDVLKRFYDKLQNQMPYLGLYWPTKYHAKKASLKLTEKANSEKFVIYNMEWEK